MCLSVASLQDTLIHLCIAAAEPKCSTTPFLFQQLIVGYLARPLGTARCNSASTPLHCL